MSSIRRVLLTGDVHGNTGWMLRHVLPQARRHGCDLVLQLGDFGIWPGEGGRRYLNAVDSAFGKARIPVWLIDGNHEDFDQLFSLPLNESGVRPVREHITHIPRGHRWTWSGRTILACGGAVSVDVMFRTPGRNWWPQEEITQADVTASIRGGPADVLFSHDVSTDACVIGDEENAGLPVPLVFRMAANHLALQEIVDAVRPSLQVHGHFHIPADRTVARHDKQVRVISLNCDSGAATVANGHCAVLDLAALEHDVAGCVTVID